MLMWSGPQLQSGSTKIHRSSSTAKAAVASAM